MRSLLRFRWRARGQTGPDPLPVVQPVDGHPPLVRRAHVRLPIPPGVVGPGGLLHRNHLGCVPVDLIDISDGGTCVLLAMPIAIQPGDIVDLSLDEIDGPGRLQLAMEVRWLLELPTGLRLGGRFLDREFRPSRTFLRPYLMADLDISKQPGC